MSKPLYESRFSKDELYNLKASECSKLKENEVGLTVVVGMMMILTFVMFVMLVALFLWFNKVTIFLSIVMGALTLIMYWLYYKGYVRYKALITDIKERISSQEKQVL
jgi:drug/metabolite transporter (DMT)-like permease